MNSHQEEDALKKERNLKMYGSNNAHHQEAQNLHNMMILNKMPKTINKRSHQWMSRTTQWERKLSTSGKQKTHQMIWKTQREENGELIKNSSGEKVIVLREWNLLLTP